MEEKELITVIVPAYNVAEWLPRCLDSILKQTCNDLEILVIDDGSTDATGKIADEYGKKDKRIRIIHHDPFHTDRMLEEAEPQLSALHPDCSFALAREEIKL